MRVGILSLASITFLMWTLPVHAQVEPENNAAERESKVRVTLQSRIPNTASALHFPLALIQRLDDQESLINLEVQTNDRETQLSAQFAFESMDSFRQWYQKTSTQEVIHLLNKQHSRTSLALHLARESHPLE